MDHRHGLPRRPRAPPPSICREDVWAAALWGSMVYVSSAWLVSKCLTPVAVRQDLASWESFRRRHRWRIFGFGLGPALVLQARPVLGLALLGWLHLAAAGLMADLHAADGRAAPCKLGPPA
ncbi:unnamed protein product [Prorocentrum cordatum]|uniref:Uncharacterized protein n=1 Tax=Prorocentrum cordatum TaxID=2364126 RepID=A0ABN9S792_9DINO|nr:unnamed protein product [Polarella glacialis]